MDLVWLSITLASVSAAVSCDQAFDWSRIRAFPGGNRTIAGVSQITYMDGHHSFYYAFNASQARDLCSSLGLTIASKAQVGKSLARGLETCRFGWVDEHLAVVPRRTPQFNCGQNQTGLVIWRADVTKKFDVFCFNESDAESQLRTTTAADSIAASEQTRFPTEALNSTQSETPTSPSVPHSSPSAAPESESTEAQPARFLGGAQSSSGAKVILITSSCAVILLAVIIVAYIKMRQGRSRSSDLKQHEEDISTEEQTCLKTIKQSAAADNLRIEEDSEESCED